MIMGTPLYPLVAQYRVNPVVALSLLTLTMMVSALLPSSGLLALLIVIGLSLVGFMGLKGGRSAAFWYLIALGVGAGVSGLSRMKIQQGWLHPDLQGKMLLITAQISGVPVTSNAFSRFYIEPLGYPELPSKIRLSWLHPVSYTHLTLPTKA